MKKLKEEVVKRELLHRGYTLLSEYKGVSKKILCEKDGYWYYVKYYDIIYNKKPNKFGVLNPFIKHNILQLINDRKFNVKFIDYYIKEKNKRKRIYVKLLCSCGNVFIKTIDDMQRSNRNICCNKCSIGIRASKKQKSYSEIVSDFNAHGFYVIENQQHKNTQDKFIVMNKQGYKGYISYRHMMQGESFAIFSMKTNRDNFIYNARQYCIINKIPSYIIGLSKNRRWSRQGIVVQCSCGTKFETSISSFCSGKTRCSRCVCRQSKYEKIVSTFLKDNNIEYIFQYSVNGCKDTNLLRFDFYLPKYNAVIEVDGEQHFYPIKYSQYDTQEKCFERFQYIVKHDNIKTTYCNENNITLLRIAYTDIKNKQYANKIIQLTKK